MEQEYLERKPKGTKLESMAVVNTGDEDGGEMMRCKS
jgi:hypothetical protein